MSIYDNIAEAFYKKYAPDLVKLEKQLDIAIGKLDWIIANLTPPVISLAGPTVASSPASALEGATELTILDLDTLPDEMRQAGFVHSNDNALYYAMCCKVYPGWEWPLGECGVEEAAIKLWHQQEEMREWMYRRVVKIRLEMRANRNLTATVIVNDGPDRCGERIGRIIMEELSEFGARVKLGEVYYG